MIAKVYEHDYLKTRLQPHAGVDNGIRYSKEYRPIVFAEYKRALVELAIKKEKVKSVLDFGCADGILLEFCKGYFSPDTELYGTDISKNMLNTARKKGWKVFPLDQLGKLDKKFDLIILWEVIEHVENPGAIISTLRRKLSSKGRIVMATPRFGILGELFGEQWAHLLPVQHLNIASKEGMQKFARRMGMKIDKYQSFGAHAPSSVIPQPHKRIFDQLANTLDFGDAQIASVKQI